MSVTSREQLHQQIDQLPDHIVEQIANFTSSIITQQSNIPKYSNWEDKDWQEFSLQNFFCEENEIEYCLEDAQEIYTP
jgi:ASC-1-like (ASCH) protein